MTQAPLWRDTASVLHAQVREGRCSVTQIVTSSLERIAQCEPAVQAWAWHDAAAVRAAAQQADLDGARGALSGVTIGIKDIIDTADCPTAYGSRLYQHHRPARDATLVTRLRAAGAIILGKTVTAEFAYSSPGATRNPHDLTRTPGGSSSGSAAAVAAGMCAVAVSSQTGGSTIRPAAFCGVVGFKPSYGLIDSTGMKPLAPSSDTVGLHARSVDDIAMVFAVLAAGSVMVPAVSSPSDRPMRIGWFPGPSAAQASPQASAVLENVRRLLLAHGTQLVTPDVAQDDVARLAEINSLSMAVEGARSLAQEYRLHRDRLTAPTLQFIETGLAIPDARYQEALACIARCRRAFDIAMEDVDALLTFSAPGVAPRSNEGLGSSLFNRPWSALGTPCVNLPAGFADGLPLGVQLVGRLHADAALLVLARRVEGLLPPVCPAPLS